MIIALAILAALMTVCGAAALVNGWDVVLTERGWTQVIAGATGLTGGLLLIGLTCVVAELKRLRREIISAVMEPDDLPAAPVRLDPRAAAIGPDMAAAMAGTAGSLAPTGHRPDADGDAGDDAPKPEDEPVEQAIERPSHTVQAGPPDAWPTLSEPPPAESPETHHESGGFTKTGDEAEAGAPTPADPHVIGTHSSAGITYYMFSDDSIEAEMEHGRFRFDDMDALRRFLATGEGGVQLIRADADRLEPHG